MSSDNNLQEMEAGTTQSKTAVNAGAKPADPMPTMADPGTQLGSVEDLGGPTPQNYKPDDDSAKLKEPSLKTVSNVVNAKAGKADPMPKGMKEEEEVEAEEVVAEAEESTEEVVSEEETTTEATTEEVVDEYDMEEDVNALLAGEELSEEFQEKARTIFEAAINSKVAGIKEELEQQYAVAFEEEMKEVKESLAERVDSYLEYVADEWFSENALAIEKGLQSEMTESFLSGMKDLFEAHYVTIPEDKYDAFVGMTNKLDEMETKLNEQLEKNISLNKRLSEANASGILDQISEGLAQTQKEKLASLAESVEFESEAQYREKLETLKESYFNSKKESSVAKTESISEGVDSSPASITGSMDQYLKMMNSFKHS